MNRRADTDSGIGNLVHGSEQDARELRANLATFARRTDDPNIRRLVSNVLAGRRNVREIFRTPEFLAAAGTHLDKIEEGLANLTDEERAQVWDQTRARTDQSTLNAMRDAHDPGGPLLPPEKDNDDRTYLKQPRPDQPTPSPRARRPRPPVDDDEPPQTILKRRP